MTADAANRADDRADDPPWPEPRADGDRAEDAFPVPFSIANGLSLAIWTLIALIIGAVLVASAGADLTDPLINRVSVLVGQGVALFGTIALLRSTGRLSWRLAGPVRPRVAQAGKGVLVGIAGVGIVILWAQLYTLVFGEPDAPEQALLQDVTASAAVVVLSYVVVVVMAPVIEEVVYRGVLFQAVRRQLGLWPGVVVSAFVFTAVHLELYPPGGRFQPVALVGLFLLGGWFALQFHRSGTIVVPIVAHATFNAVNLTIAVTLA